ncbi:MAG: hypothetical protein R6V54_03665 [Desulfobacteraceae bacterium]
MKKSRDNRVKSASFSIIKRNLDPKRSCVVFEKKTDQRDAGFFFHDTDLLGFLETKKIPWQTFYDGKNRRKYLVTEFLPGDEEELIGYILVHGLPEDTTYYLFKAK